MIAILVDKKGFKDTLYIAGPKPIIYIRVFEDLNFKYDPESTSLDQPCGLQTKQLAFHKYRCVDPQLEVYEYREI